MSYIKPSVLVYQDLLNAGGVLNATPDLEACIIGPAYQSLTYVPGSLSSQIKTAAYSTTSTTGNIAAASNTLTVVSVAGLAIGDTILVVGAGSSGSTLQAVASNIAGNVITLDTAASTTVTGAVVTKTGTITNNTVNNTFSLPGQIVGQVVDASSVRTWLDDVKVQTLGTGVDGSVGNSTVTISPLVATGNLGTGASISGVANSPTYLGEFQVGDIVTVSAGAPTITTFTTTVTGVSAGVTLTLLTNGNGGVSSTGVVITRVAPVNLNSTTNSLRAEPGDPVAVTYKDFNGDAQGFYSAIQTVTTSSGLNGTVSSFNFVDMVPANACKQALGTTTANSTTVAVLAVVNKTVSGAAWAAGSVTITTSTSHGLVLGDVVTFSGITTTPANAMNKTFIVSEYIDATNFKVALATNPGAFTLSGTSYASYGTGNSGFVNGATLIIKGAGANGADYVGTMTAALSGQNATVTPAVPTAITGARIIVVNKTIGVKVQKLYNDLELPATKPISGGANFSTANVGVNGQVTVNSGAEVSYGTVVSGKVFFSYKALRTDLANRVLTINDTLDLVGQLGEVTDDNPLALGVRIALANTTGRVRAIAVESNDILGYQSALTAAEGERLYALVPLSQDIDILTTFKAHAVQLSTPENASWRVAIVNTAIPVTEHKGPYTALAPNYNGGTNAVTLVNGNYILTATDALFSSDGVTPGDTIHFTATTPGTGVGSHTILQVLNNQQVVVDVTATYTGVSYYVTRTLSKTQQAANIKAVSESFGSNRVWHIQPDTVGISVNGVTKYLPGYYLACGLAGMTAGFPVQQGFTNIGVAGISDLSNSNFYFSKANLNTMAEGGTCLLVQETQGGIPYVRHEMTTDVSTLVYREILTTKNFDFLSYFYYDKLKGFIGSWNITPDSINIIRQSIIASSELVKAKKLPKIGPPLLSYKIQKMEQNKYNKDNLDVEVVIEIVYPLNYLNLHLIV